MRQSIRGKGEARSKVLAQSKRPAKKGTTQTLNTARVAGPAVRPESQSRPTKKTHNKGPTSGSHRESTTRTKTTQQGPGLRPGARRPLTAKNTRPPTTPGPRTRTNNSARLRPIPQSLTPPKQPNSDEYNELAYKKMMGVEESNLLEQSKLPVANAKESEPALGNTHTNLETKIRNILKKMTERNEQGKNYVKQIEKEVQKQAQNAKNYTTKIEEEREKNRGEQARKEETRRANHAKNAKNDSSRNSNTLKIIEKLSVSFIDKHTLPIIKQTLKEMTLDEMKNLLGYSQDTIEALIKGSTISKATLDAKKLAEQVNQANFDTIQNTTTLEELAALGTTRKTEYDKAKTEFEKTMKKEIEKAQATMRTAIKKEKEARNLDTEKHARAQASIWKRAAEGFTTSSHNSQLKVLQSKRKTTTQLNQPTKPPPKY